MGTGWGGESLRVASGVDLDAGRGREQRDYEDSILHRLISIWTADEVVATVIVGWHHTGIGGITIDAAGGRPIPVHQFVGCDVVVDRGGPGLEGRNERFGEI